MKTVVFLGLSLTAALSLTLPATAGPSGGGQSSSAGSGAPTSAGSGHGGGSPSGGGGHVSFAPQGGGVVSHNAGPAFHAGSGFHGAVISPFIAQPRVIPAQNGRGLVAVNRNGAVVQTAPVVIARPPTFAFGGHPIAEARNDGRVPRPNGGWDRNWDRIWHGRHFHWNNGAWVVINDGYYPWGDSYYAPSSSDVYPNASYEYDSQYSAGVVPAPAAIPANPEDSIAADVQQSLAALGYYHGEITGIVSDITRAAIADFQKDNDLQITGYITKSLLNALGLSRPGR